MYMDAQNGVTYDSDEKQTDGKTVGRTTSKQPAKMMGSDTTMHSTGKMRT